MVILKTQEWRPDTHPGYVLEVEWEYDKNTGRDTGREHRGVSVRYPDGSHVHSDTHGADVAHEHYKKLYDEHVVKNQAYKIIVESLPAHMTTPSLDESGRPVLDESGRPRLVLKDGHLPRFNHLGNGKYTFSVPGLDEGATREITAKLTHFGERVALLTSA